VVITTVIIVIFSSAGWTVHTSWSKCCVSGG